MNSIVTVGAALGLLVFAVDKLRRRQLERRETLEAVRGRLGILPERPDDGRVHCCRCGGPIAVGDIIVASPPNREGPQTAHFDCPLTPIRPRGLPGDKRWRESYDRDTDRLLRAFTSPRTDR